MSNETKDRKRAVLRRRMAVTSTRTALVFHGQGCVAAMVPPTIAPATMPGPQPPPPRPRQPRRHCTASIDGAAAFCNDDDAAIGTALAGAANAAALMAKTAAARSLLGKFMT